MPKEVEEPVAVAQVRCYKWAALESRLAAIATIVSTFAELLTLQLETMYIMMLILRLGVSVDSFDLLCLGADLGECQNLTFLTGWKSFRVNGKR